jgi:hypothetical protein
VADNFIIFRFLILINVQGQYIFAHDDVAQAFNQILATVGISWRVELIIYAYLCEHVNLVPAIRGMVTSGRNTKDLLRICRLKLSRNFDLVPKNSEM